MLMVVWRPRVDGKKRPGCAHRLLAPDVVAVRPNATTTAFAITMATSHLANHARQAIENANILRQCPQLINLNGVKVRRQQLVKRYVQQNLIRSCSCVIVLEQGPSLFLPSSIHHLLPSHITIACLRSCHSASSMSWRGHLINSKVRC